VDTTKTTTHLGLCAGYGGIELGLKRVIPNLRSVALCEIEAYACANLVAKMEAGLMEPAPIWTDLKTFPWAEFRDRVDILTGGYPCQPFSAAGKRLGTEDPRHLWPFIASGIRILRPKLCFFENVEGHISLGLREVIGELESMGYKVSWGIFSAREVGAPHQRKRVFILAVSNSLGGAAGLSRSLAWNEGVAGESNHGSCEGCGELADTGRIEPQGWCGAADGQQSGAGRIPRGEPAPCHDQVWPSRPGEPQHGWEPPRVVANSVIVGRRGGDHADAGGLRGEIQTTGSCGSGGGEVVGNSIGIHEYKCSGRESEQLESWDASEAMGNAELFRLQHGRIHKGWQDCCKTNGLEEKREYIISKIESTLGGDFDGTSDRMDYAELSVSHHAAGRCESGVPVINNRELANGINNGCYNADQRPNSNGEQGALGETTETEARRDRIHSSKHGETIGNGSLYISCDNRTDELRLLGNGVVPATAERAFRTLLEELNA